LQRFRPVSTGDFAPVEDGVRSISIHNRLCLDKSCRTGLNNRSDWTVNSISRVARRDHEGHARDRAGFLRKENPPMQCDVLKPGCAYSFLYPRHNYRQLPVTTELRRLVVESVRDTNGQPLDQSTASLNPLLKRGRWLVRGKDLDKDAERSFYAESMSNIRVLSNDERELLDGTEYVVIDHARVTFQATRLNEAMTFRSERRTGVICGVLSRGARDLGVITAANEVAVPDAAEGIKP
jgi:hypothetical protein